MAKGIKTGGRIAGTPNKVTAAVKDNVVEVFNQIGGQEEMATWAKDNRTEFYRLYAKLLPHQVNTDVTRSERPNELSDDELRAIICDSAKERKRLEREIAAY